MTLVLTEVSEAGIAMAADSAITYLQPDGKLKEIDQKGWLKLLKVPSIRAAISYWGCVGYITKEPFHEWLKRKIKNTDNYTDLSSFCDYLSRELNSACGDKPLKDKQCVGIHVAGYNNWADGVSRPFFYHIHNGHGDTKVQEVRDQQTGNLLKVIPKWDPEPRKLFEKHQDFPRQDRPISGNLLILKGGHITRNGDYFIYAVLDRTLKEIFHYINHIDGCRIPRDNNKIGPRKGLLKMMLETVVMIYGCSSLETIIGGHVTSLGISPDGTYLEDKRS